MENYIYIFLIAGGIIFIAYLWIGRNANDIETVGLTSKKESLKILFPLKIQAYERLVLFLERSKPTSLVLRILPMAKTAEELKILLLNTLNDELEHNFSQQIYVSEPLWQQILFTKERLQQIINQVTREEQAETAQILAEQILLAYAKEDDFVANTLLLLRNEARIFQQYPNIEN